MKQQANGVQLFYETSGSGRSLILLHGSGEDHHIFDPLAAKLSAHFSVYAIDSRNHGESEQTGVYDYAVMAADLRGFITGLSLGPVHLLGFSDGAIISLLLALSHPELVASMALLGVNLSPGDFDPGFLARLQSSYERKGNPLVKQMLEQPDISLDSLRAITAPTLVVGAEKDLFRPTLFPAIANVIPQSTLKIMAGHEHDTYISGQDILYPDLMNFYSSIL